MNICLECKWFKGDANDVYFAQMQSQKPPPECTHPEAKTRDPIYGKCYCQNERQMGTCGKNGKLFEKKT